MLGDGAQEPGWQGQRAEEVGGTPRRHLREGSTPPALQHPPRWGAAAGGTERCWQGSEGKLAH